MSELLNTVIQGDCIETMRSLGDNSVNLIVIDPPYNIGKDKRWDKWETVDGYVAFMVEVFKECERVLKPNGSFYWFHNDMTQIRKLMDALDSETSFDFKNLIIWNKRYEGSKRKYYFDNVIKTEGSRMYRPLTEYCLFYTFQDGTGLDRIMLDVNNFRTLRDYFEEVRKYIGTTKKVIIDRIGQRADHCFRSNSTQWDLPTSETYAALIGEFNIRDFEGFREYESLRLEYESLRLEYESQRYTFNNLKTHHDVWDFEVAPKQGHVTPKPVELIENIILHSSNPEDLVLDCFLGSGTTAVAAINTNRQFIGIEREPEYVAIANQRIIDAIKTKEATANVNE